MWLQFQVSPYCCRDEGSGGISLIAGSIGLLWVHMLVYHMFCDPASAETTHSLGINDAYLRPMHNERTLSFAGYQDPRLPTMNG